jgi:pSer/pThr/pTyr-binding forkhead associated (FHA) protein
VIRNAGGAYTVSDLGSRNGTFVNGERITQPRTLRHGDVIGLGLSKLTFRRAGHSETGAIDVTEFLPTAPTPSGPPPLTEDSLAQAVISAGLVAQREVDRVRGQGSKGRRLYRSLVEDKLAGDDALRDLMSKTFRIDTIDLDNATIDDALIVKFPSSVARQYHVFPVDRSGSGLILAVADPTDSAAIEEAKRKTGRAIDLRLAASSAITKQIERHYGPKLIGVLPSGEKLEYAVTKQEIEIGKAQHNNIVLTDPTVSNTHAIVIFRNGGYSIVDLGSRNGTFVNGEKLGDSARTLRHGDSIQLGQTVVTFRNPDETREHVTATLSADALEEVRRRAASAHPGDASGGAGIPQNLTPPAQPLVAAPGGEPLASPGTAESEEEKKKKKKKKKGAKDAKDERIKAAYIRAIGTILGPILSVAATVGLTIYLMRPASAPSPTPSMDTTPKGKGKLRTALASGANRFEGGIFEASGVVEVPGTDGVLFVDDGKPGQVLWMQVDGSTGKQVGAIKAIDLGVKVDDPEDITFDGSYFYVIGSQSEAKWGDGNALVRFVFDPANVALQGQAEAITNLRDFLFQQVPELKGFEEVKSVDGGLNVEAVAWDPDRARLLLGLRGPLIGGSALVVPVRLRDPRGPFSVDNLQLAESNAIKLSLGGLGFRDIEYDRRMKSFLLIAGAPENLDKGEFSLWAWNGDPDQSKPESQPRKEEVTLDRAMKPEGVTHFGSPTGGFIFVVGDGGSYLKIDYGEGL